MALFKLYHYQPYLVPAGRSEPKRQLSGFVVEISEMRPIEGNNVDTVGLCREFGKACVYRKFDSGWTRGTDGVSMLPDDGFVQAVSPRPGLALQVES